jgi:AcrR family transcriptional regulator
MRRFSDDEREEIRENLVDTAREKILQHGFQKTNVKDITGPVGIAESTFYTFFDSKSDIFVSVLAREQEALIDTVEAELEGAHDPEERLERFIRAWMTEFEERPIMMLSHQPNRELLRSVNRERVRKLQEKFAERLTPLVEELQAESDGIIGEIESYHVIEILSVLELAVAQRDLYEEYGRTEYTEFRDIFIKVISRGLVEGGTTE